MLLKGKAIVVEMSGSTMDCWGQIRRLLRLRKDQDVLTEIAAPQNLRWFFVDGKHGFLNYEEHAECSFKNSENEQLINLLKKCHSVVFRFEVESVHFDNANLLEFLLTRELASDLSLILNLACQKVPDCEIEGLMHKLAHLLSDALDDQDNGKSPLLSSVLIQERSGELISVSRSRQPVVYRKLLPILKIDKDKYERLFRSRIYSNSTESTSTTMNAVRRSVDVWYESLQTVSSSARAQVKGLKQNTARIRSEFESEPLFLEFLFLWFLHFTVNSRAGILADKEITRGWSKYFGCMSESELAQVVSLSKRYFVGICELVENSIHHTSMGTCFLLLELIENPFGPYSAQKFGSTTKRFSNDMKRMLRDGCLMESRNVSKEGKKKKYYLTSGFLIRNSSYGGDLEKLKEKTLASKLLNLTFCDSLSGDKFREYVEKYIGTSKCSNSGVFLHAILADNNSHGIPETYDRKTSLNAATEPTTLSSFFLISNHVLESGPLRLMRNVAHLGLAVFANIFKEQGFISVRTGFRHREGLVLSPISEPVHSEKKTVPGVGTSFHLIIPLSEDLVKTVPGSIPKDTTSFPAKFSKILCDNKYADLKDVRSISISALFEGKGVASRETELDSIKEIAKDINDVWDNSPCAIAFNLENANDINIFSRLLKVVGFLQVDANTDVKNFIVFYNIPTTTMRSFTHYLQVLRETPRFWSESVWIYAYDVEGVPLIVGGEEYEDFVEINKKVRAYYGNSFAISENVEFENRLKSSAISTNGLQRRHRGENKWRKLDPIIPFEVLVRGEGHSPCSYPIFEDVCSSYVNENNQGLVNRRAHVRIGSKLHVDDFVKAIAFFKNRFFVQRFAFLNARRIIDSLNSTDEQSMLVLLTYGSFSHPLARSLHSILDEYVKKHNPSWRVVRDYFVCSESPDQIIWHDSRKLRLITENIEKSYDELKYAIVIPIASTLTTNWKIIQSWAQKLAQDVTGEEPNLRSIRENVVHNSVILLLRDGDTQDATRLERGHGWSNRINLSQKTVNTDFFGEKPIYYLTAIKTRWISPLDCSLCFPDLEEGRLELLLRERVLLEVSPDILEPMPRLNVENAPIMPSSDSVSFDLFVRRLLGQSRHFSIHELIVALDESEIDYLSFLRTGHCKRNSNHYRYYVETTDLLEKRFEQIQGWLDKIKDEIHHEEPENLEIQIPCEWKIIYPIHDTNIDFVRLVNDRLFRGYAEPIPFMADCDISLQLETSALDSFAEPANKYLFVDDAILTGRTFEQAHEFLKKATGKRANFEKALVLVHHLSSQSCEGKAVDPFLTLHSHASSANKCSICEDLKDLHMLEESLKLDRLKDFVRDEIGRFELVEAALNDIASRWDLSLLAMQEYIWNQLASIGNEEDRGSRFLVILRKVSDAPGIESRGRLLTQIFLVKALSHMRLIQQKEVADKVLNFHLELFVKVLKDSSLYTGSGAFLSFLLLIELMKNLANLKSTSILRKSVIHKVWSAYRSFLSHHQNVLKDTEDFHERERGMLEQVFLLECGDLDKICSTQRRRFHKITNQDSLQNWIRNIYDAESFQNDARIAIEVVQKIKHFRYFYVVIAKQVIQDNEVRSFLLDRLLRPSPVELIESNGPDVPQKERERDFGSNIASLFDDLTDSEIRRDFERFWEMLNVENNTTLEKVLRKKIPLPILSSDFENFLAGTKEVIGSKGTLEEVLDSTDTLEELVSAFGDSVKWDEETLNSPYFATYRRLIHRQSRTDPVVRGELGQSSLHRKMQLLLILSEVLGTWNSSGWKPIALPLESRLLIHFIRILFDSRGAVLYVADRAGRFPLYRLAYDGEGDFSLFPKIAVSDGAQLNNLILEQLMDFAQSDKPFTYRFVVEDGEGISGCAIKLRSNYRRSEMRNSSLGIIYLALRESEGEVKRREFEQNMRLFLLVKEEIREFLRRNLDNESVSEMMEYHSLSQILVSRFKNYQHDIEGRATELSQNLNRNFREALRKSPPGIETLNNDTLSGVLDSAFIEANLRLGYYFWKYLVVHSDTKLSTMGMDDLVDLQNFNVRTVTCLREELAPIIECLGRDNDHDFSVKVDFQPKHGMRKLRLPFQSLFSYVLLLILNATQHQSVNDPQNPTVDIEVRGNDLLILSERTKKPANMNALKEKVYGQQAPEEGITLFTIHKYVKFQSNGQAKMDFTINWVNGERFEARFVNILKEG